MAGRVRAAECYIVLRANADQKYSQSSFCYRWIQQYGSSHTTDVRRFGEEEAAGPYRRLGLCFWLWL
eukprot:COSAG01_NODE_66917_length_268_cov_1.224852_1_plen_66_part_10